MALDEDDMLNKMFSQKMGGSGSSNTKNCIE